jgi:hypothetical protein
VDKVGDLHDGDTGWIRVRVETKSFAALPVKGPEPSYRLVALHPETGALVCTLLDGDNLPEIPIARSSRSEQRRRATPSALTA